jgi:hypothetical protein
MKRQYLLLFFIVSALIDGRAQSDQVWKFASPTTNASLAMMETDSVGNTYLTGTFNDLNFRYNNLIVEGMTGDQTLNTYILKIDPTGKPLWLYSLHGDASETEVKPKTMSISNRGEMALIVTADKTNNVTFGDQIIETDPNQTVPILIKLSKTGNISWCYPLYCFGDTPSIVASDLFVEETGDVYVTGYFEGNSAELNGQLILGLEDNSLLFVACIHSDGELAWFHRSNYLTGELTGHLKGLLIEDAPGNFFYLAGTHQGNRTFILGNDSLIYSNQTDVFIARYSKDGAALWAEKFAGDSYDYPEKLRVLNNGDALVMGMSASPYLYVNFNVYMNGSGAYNIFLADYNSEGIYKNSDYLPTQKPTVTNFDRNAFLNIDQFGNVYIGSEFYSSSLFSAANTIVNPSPGSSDIFIAKLNSSSLDPYWTFHGTANGNNLIEGVKFDRFGNSYIGGTAFFGLEVTDGSVPADATVGVPYLAKVRDNGQLDYLYWQNNAGNALVHITAVSSDAFGNTFIAGDFTGTESSIDNIGLVDFSEQGIFVGKYAYVKSIQGQVINPMGDEIQDGYVKLFGYTLYQRSAVNDSVRIGVNGTFHFANVPYGNYILTAVPGIIVAEPYLPTYYPAAEYWEFAEKIRIDEQSTQNFFTITLQQKSEFKGQTQIWGNVQEEDNTKKFNNVNYDKARPVRKTTVVLAGNKKQVKSTYQIICYVETDDEGNFSFDGIEDGSYYVWVDIPGLPCEPVHFIEISGGQYISNLDYLVNEEIVEGIGHPVYNSIGDQAGSEGYSFFPNPAKDFITVSLENSINGTIDLYDSKGMHLQHFILENKSTVLDLSDYDAGNYLVRLMTEEYISFEKITIVR